MAAHHTAIVMLVLGLVTCKGDDMSRLPPADQVYTVRGQVERRASDSTSLVIHHESLPGFIDGRGQRVGMEAMSMSFSVAPNVDTADVSAGDKVEFTFEVRHKTEPMLRVTRLRELPAATKLDFQGKASDEHAGH